MTPSLFVAAWPIEDDTLTLPELIAQAEADLPDVLFDADVQLLGTPSWTTADVVGPNPTGDDLVLILTAPAAPWRDTTKARRGRPAHRSAA